MHDEFHGHVNTVTYESNLSESEPVGSYLKCQNRQFSFTVAGELAVSKANLVLQRVKK